MQEEVIREAMSPSMVEALGPALFMGFFIVIIMVVVLVPMFSKIYNKNDERIYKIQENYESKIEELYKVHVETIESRDKEFKNFVVSSNSSLSELQKMSTSALEKVSMNISEVTVTLKEMRANQDSEIKALRETHKTLKDGLMQTNRLKLLTDILANNVKSDSKIKK